MHVVGGARRSASLDADMGEPAERLSGDPVVGPLLRKRPGLRVPGTWDPYETGVRAILGQHVSVAGANTLVGRLVERLGTPVSGLDRFGLTHIFPPPETLAEADLAELRPHGGKGRGSPLLRAGGRRRQIRREPQRPASTACRSIQAMTGSAVDGELTSPCGSATRRVADDRLCASAASLAEHVRRSASTGESQEPGGPGGRSPRRTSGWPKRPPAVRRRPPASRGPVDEPGRADELVVALASSIRRRSSSAMARGHHLERLAGQL